MAQILHICDATDPDLEQQQKTVATVMEQLEALPLLQQGITVYNKTDLLSVLLSPSLPCTPHRVLLCCGP